MSAGEFDLAGYECDDGSIATIRVQPETLEFAIGEETNAGSAEESNVKTRVRSRKPKRRYGVGARSVTVKWTGAVPDKYVSNGRLTIPILTPALYDLAKIRTTGTYLGQDVKVVSKQPETAL